MLCCQPTCSEQCAPLKRSACRPPRRAVDLVLALVFDLPAPREAERRFCVVGRPAWMPGEPCWARDGPSRRALGAGPERGTLERSEGRTLTGDRSNLWCSKVLAIRFRRQTKTGGRCTRVGEPVTLRKPGRPEDLPRTAAIKHCEQNTRSTVYSNYVLI